MPAPMIRLLWAFAAGCSYLILAAVSRELGGDLVPSPLWLATASVTAIALLSPLKYQWSTIVGGMIGLIVSAFVVFDNTWLGLLRPLIANTLEVSAIVLGLDIVLGSDRVPHRTRHGLWTLAVIVGGAALSGVVRHVDFAQLATADHLERLVVWTLGNAVGEMLVVPVVLWRRSRLLSDESSRLQMELAATVIGIGAFGATAFYLSSPATYLIVPAVLWLAIRFGPLTSTVFSLVASIASTVATGQGVGPFVDFGGEPTVQVQLFNIALGVCSLLGGAHALRAWTDQRRLRAVVSSLPDGVVFRDSAGEVISSWAPEDVGQFMDHLDPVGTETLEASRELLVPADGVFLERRRFPIPPTGVLELYRDVTSEQIWLRESRRRIEAVAEARTEEQRRLGQRLHDSPIQLLAAASQRLEAVRLSKGTGDHLAIAHQLTMQAIDELRATLTELIPPDLASGELQPALLDIGRQLLADTTTIAIGPEPDVPLNAELSELLFLVGREALANVAFHAEASRVEISVTSDDSTTVMRISDDGIGMAAPSESGSGLGLPLMRERIAESGGVLEIQDRTPSGTTLVVTVANARSGDVDDPGSDRNDDRVKL